MLLIVFNGMVVFETGLIRWAGWAMFAGLAIAWLLANPRPGLSLVTLSGRGDKDLAEVLAQA